MSTAYLPLYREHAPSSNDANYADNAGTTPYQFPTTFTSCHVEVIGIENFEPK